MGASLSLIDRDGAALEAVLPGLSTVSRHVGDVADEELWDELSVALTPLTHALINAGRPVQPTSTGSRRTFLGAASLHSRERCVPHGAPDTDRLAGFADIVDADHLGTVTDRMHRGGDAAAEAG